MPRLQTLGQVTADPDVQAELAPGNIFVLVPCVIETSKPARANISLDSGMLEAIDASARRAGLTRSAFLASAARDKIMNEA